MQNKQLRFKEDGTFKIVQFTDLHWQNGEAEDRRTTALLERVLAEEKPDLVVFTGDLIYSNNCKDAVRSIKKSVDPAVRSGTPWAVVFGNHDSEGNVSRRELMEGLQTLSGCLSSCGPRDIDGIGNYALDLLSKSGKLHTALYFLDSGSYSVNPAVSGYDWIRENQIEWYRHAAARNTRENAGTALPSLVFFHIPIPEYKEVWRTQVCFGRKYEDISSAKVNSGLFTAMIEEGGVLGTFCGHDHINDFEGSLHGVRLCYGRASGYHTYGRWLFHRGARVIELREGGLGFDSWVRLDNGRELRNPPVHKPGRFGYLRGR